ncbi:MAG TPA: GGDEF domain-containing protein [bacterium]|nr:GGDEF domain-containing protein [bacterium]
MKELNKSIQAAEQKLRIDVMTRDDELWNILDIWLTQKGLFFRRITYPGENNKGSSLLILDGRMGTFYGDWGREAAGMDPDTPVLWIVDENGPCPDPSMNRSAFSEIIRYPIREFEFHRRLFSLTHLVEMKNIMDARDRSLRSETSRWKKKAFTDSITGLYNYRYFTKRLTMEIRRVKRLNDPISLVIFDLDDFKVLNDQYGHLAGNRLLREVGRLIRRSVKKSGVVARYGGDEFILILPSVDKNTAVRVAEKISSLFQDPLKNSDVLCRITLSAGIAEFPVDADEITALIRCADDALYHAKAGGKQQIRAYQSKDWMRT